MSAINIYNEAPLIQIAIPAPESIKQRHAQKVQQMKEVFQIDLSINETPARAVLFKNQYLDARWSFVHNGAHDYILQSGYLKSDTLIISILNSDGSNPEKLSNDYVYFMAYNHDYANYYHWTVQTLPALSLYLSLRNVYGNLRLLLPENLPEFAREYLSILEIDPATDITFLKIQERPYFAEQLIYPSFLGGEFAFNTSELLLQFAATLLEKKITKGDVRSAKNNEEKEHPKKKILYCARLDSKNRKIINEGALIDVLKNKFDAQIYISTGQTVKNQILNFYTADLIISPHGAGMSNLMYCNETASIIEFLPDKYTNPCYAALAINKVRNYKPFVFPTRTFDGHQHNYEWEIDIKTVEDALNSLISN